MIFQFHKGTIDTPITLKTTGSSQSFQFHKGTIDTRASFRAEYDFANFNSIKVRLIPIESNGINTTKHNELGSTKMQKILEINVDAQLYF